MELIELINKIDKIVKSEPPDVAVTKILRLPEHPSLLLTATVHLLVIYANKTRRQSHERQEDPQ